MHTLWKKSLAGLVVAMVAATCLGFAAGSSHKSRERGTDVTFIGLTKFANGNTLSAGTYRMEVPEHSQTPEVTFSKDGKVISTVRAKVVAQKAKNTDMEIESVTQGKAQMVTAIRPAGWNESLFFTPGTQHNSAKTTR
jgi:ABC-type glycerol-3-phosphate transport system substrate-binding protein